MAEAIINYFTIEHFFFGLGVVMIISFLFNRKQPVPTISFFIIVLWELFEIREHPIYWRYNYMNNIMDLIVGLLAIFIGERIWKKLYKPHKMS